MHTLLEEPFLSFLRIEENKYSSKHLLQQMFNNRIRKEFKFEVFI